MLVNLIKEKDSRDEWRPNSKWLIIKWIVTSSETEVSSRLWSWGAGVGFPNYAVSPFSSSCIYIRNLLQNKKLHSTWFCLQYTTSLRPIWEKHPAMYWLMIDYLAYSWCYWYIQLCSQIRHMQTPYYETLTTAFKTSTIWSKTIFIYRQLIALIFVCIRSDNFVFWPHLWGCLQLAPDLKCMVVAILTAK